MGAGTNRHRRGAHHHIGQVQQRQQHQAQLAEERVGDAEQIVHRPPVHHQGCRDNRTRQRQQHRYGDHRGAHGVEQPGRQPKSRQHARAHFRPDPDECAETVHRHHARERPQRIGCLQDRDHRRRVVHDGQRDRRDEQRATERGADDPAGDEPGSPRCGDPRGPARCRPHHQRGRRQRQHAQLLSADGDWHQVHGQPHAGDGTQGSGQVTVGDNQLDQGRSRDDDERDQRRAKSHPYQVPGLGGVGCGRQPAPDRCHSTRYSGEWRAPGQDDDVGPDGGSADSGPGPGAVGGE